MSEIRRATKVATVLLVIAALFITGCGKPAEKPAETPKTEQPQPEPKITSVKVGAVYPMSGPIAISGTRCKAAVEVAVDIINNKHAGLDLPLAATEGLPNLGGAKIDAVFGDSQASPETGRAETERLITSEKVAAMLGAYQSAVTKPASFAAERLKIPYLCGCSSSSELTKRGLEYFFRIAPTDEEDSAAFFEFLDWVNKSKQQNVKKVGLIYENTEFGVHAAKCAKEAAPQYGFEIVADVPYTFGATNLDSEVQKLKSANPDAVLAACLIGDFTLFVKTCKQLDFNTGGVLSYCGGFQDPNFIKNVGVDVANYQLGTNTFASDLIEKIPELKVVNDMFKAKSGGDFDGPAFEEFMAMIVMADAINRAGKVDPDAIRKALAETDLPMKVAIGEKISFREDGQNKDARSVMQQIVNGEYKVVYPEQLATADLVWPMPAWSKR